MKYAMTIIIIALCVTAFATPFWDFETHRAARTKIENHIAGHPPVYSYSRPAEMPAWHSHPRFSYPHELTELAAFWRYWQLLDPDSAEHGGIIEAESGELREVIQTDNTQEVVWDWAFYVAHSGDSSYLEDIDSAWVYLSNFPAYYEELSEIDPTFTSYYYRVWNSALGLLLDMGLRHMLGDASHSSYADSCARVVMFDRLPMDTEWPEINGLHALVNAFAAGALYQWGGEYTTTEYCDTAVSIAYQVQEWLDQDPESLLAHVDWAMSGGTIVWGMVNSRFTAMPESLDAWLAAHGDLIPDYIEPPDEYDALVWDNSWNIWYANGFRALWRTTGRTEYYTKYRTILDGLLIQDTDGDGGIPASAVGPDEEDMTWISAYLLLYAMDWVIDSLPEIDAGALNPTVYMPKGWATADDTVYIVAQAGNFGDGVAGEVDFAITMDWEILLDTTIHLTWGEIYPTDTFAVVPGAEGTHVVEVQTYLSDSNPWNDTARVEFEATPVRNLNGNVQDSSTSSPIESNIYFHVQFDDTSYVLDSTTSNSTGGYTIDLPCFTYDVEIVPEFPYWGETFDSIVVFPDACNLRNFTLQRADLAVIEDDTGACYVDYYRECLDSIGATYRFWNRDSIGPVPGPISGEMRRHTVLWFTGDDSSTTLDSADIASLSYILANGGNILLTGQGIMEDVHDVPGFADLVHAEWLSADGTPVLNGVSGDPISGDFGQIMLIGGTGANNQRHQDRLTPISPAEGILTYSTGAGFAAIRYEHPTSGGQIVFCAFGIEAVPYPPISETYTDREELLEAILKWFDPTFDVSEHALPNKLSIIAYPNPFNSAVSITVEQTFLSVQNGQTGMSGLPIEIEIFDIAGRRVAQLTPPSPPLTGGEGEKSPLSRGDLGGLIWQPDESLGSGVYLVRARFGSAQRPDDGQTITKRVIYLK